MITRVSSVLVALVIVVLITGCSESPTAQYDVSNTAIEQARIAEAEQYAPELFKEATDSMNAAMVEMKKQDSKFSVFRDYDKAKEIIAVAQQLAENANHEAVAEKERVRIADSTLISEIETLIEETRNLLSKAPKGKGSSVDLKVMRADIDAASGATVSATEEYNNGNYLAAQDNLVVIKSQVTEVKTDIESAIAKLKK